MFDELEFQTWTVKPYFQERQRRLTLSGVTNFRDLGGYQTLDGHTIRWKVLYRSDGLSKLTDTSLKYLSALSLDRVIDFRAEHERRQDPDRLPDELKGRSVEIPILDSSTNVWHNSPREFIRNLKRIDPAEYMIRTNTELATKFTPEMSRFFREVLACSGRPILFHCAAGKDRTGFAAAVLLKILGVADEIIFQDYLLTNEYLLAAHKWNLGLIRILRGQKFASAVQGFMEARPRYLSAAFNALEQEHGFFDKYVRDGLGLTKQDVEQLKTVYLE